jgi:2,4-dienoyl-CoA reductase-like NADH-dependent reductase (Old Yellow Enzyme family)
MKINQKITLPCGAILKNRIAKSAMSEALGNQYFESDNRLENVYKRWADGGAGLLITGNVMIDSRHLGELHNIVIQEGRTGLEALKKWAQAGSNNQTHVWMQLNHPGKQTPKFLTPKPVAPSAISLKPPLDKLFNPPLELSFEEIQDIIKRFIFAGKIAKLAGFSGVQIHGAHGYLVSQFLSPLHNQRTDSYGGSLENRMRFVIEIYQGLRKELGLQFPISIKINSSDFQKGGFSHDESIEVAKRLSDCGMDLIEISGGTYEAPEMMGINKTKKESSIIREAYFLKYCHEVKKAVTCPLMLTGGFRSLNAMEEALSENSCDVIGLARSLAVYPDFPNDLMLGKKIKCEVRPLSTGIKFLDKIIPLEIIWYTAQIHLMGKGENPNPFASVRSVALKFIFSMGSQVLKKVR